VTLPAQLVLHFGFLAPRPAYIDLEKIRKTPIFCVDSPMSLSHNHHIKTALMPLTGETKMTIEIAFNANGKNFSVQMVRDFLTVSPALFLDGKKVGGLKKVSSVHDIPNHLIRKGLKVSDVAYVAGGQQLIGPATGAVIDKALAGLLAAYEGSGQQAKDQKDAALDKLRAARAVMEDRYERAMRSSVTTLSATGRYDGPTPAVLLAELNKLDSDIADMSKAA
jgi:hypothetical protein